MASVLAVIGGSGVYSLPGLTDIESLTVETPFGAPSSSITRGRLGATSLLFLARHGTRHEIAPHQINFRANICALKMAGATHLVSLSAVGSMRESIHPGDVVIVKDFIDFTRRRISTFFDEDVVAHVAMAPAVCPELATAATEAVRFAGGRVHDSATYICIEGPQFSTRAESLLYRSWGVDVIGMTGMPEAKLAREAELPYSMIAFATDYDCWHESEEAVSVDVVLSTLKKNSELAPKIIRALANLLPKPETSPAFGALKNAILTSTGGSDAPGWGKLNWLIDAKSIASEGKEP